MEPRRIAVVMLVPVLERHGGTTLWRGR